MGQFIGVLKDLILSSWDTEYVVPGVEPRILRRRKPPAEEKIPEYTWRTFCDGDVKSLQLPCVVKDAGPRVSAMMYLELVEFVKKLGDKIEYAGGTKKGMCVAVEFEGHDGNGARLAYERAEWHLGCVRPIVNNELLGFVTGVHESTRLVWNASFSVGKPYDVPRYWEYITEPNPVEILHDSKVDIDRIVSDVETRQSKLNASEIVEVYATGVADKSERRLMHVSFRHGGCAKEIGIAAQIILSQLQQHEQLRIQYWHGTNTRIR